MLFICCVLECSFIEYEVSFNESNTLPEGAITYINTECPPDGLTINACATDGTVVLYISKIPNPNSATYDARIVIEKGKCDNTFVNCSTEDGRRKRQSAESDAGETVYIAIEGVGEENEYELNATTGDTSTPKGMIA